MNNDQDLLPFAGARLSDAQWRDRVAAMLDIVAQSSRSCKACGERIWFTRNRSGRVGVWNSDAQSHFATCPHASQLRKAAADDQH